LNIFLSYVCFFLGYLFLQLIGPIAITILIDCNPGRTKTLAINVYIILYDIGAVIGPILGGWIADQTDLLTTLLLVPIFYFLGSILFAFLLKETRKLVNLTKKMQNNEK
jgi:MFS family permease